MSSSPGGQQGLQTGDIRPPPVATGGDGRRGCAASHCRRL